jgi:hypothetical protein
METNGTNLSGVLVTGQAQSSVDFAGEFVVHYITINTIPIKTISPNNPIGPLTTNNTRRLIKQSKFAHLLQQLFFILGLRLVVVLGKRRI